MLILSSGAPLAEHFEGYAFVGADYINGHAGLEQYRQATGRTVGPNEDGCYVVARRVGRLRPTLEVGTDASGLARLYVYRSGAGWVMGSSYSGLVEHVRAAGLPLTPTLAQLRPFAIRSTFTMQLTTFQSVFDEIQLVPVGMRALIRGTRLSFDVVEPLPTVDYEQALTEYLTGWRGRARTLLGDPRVSFTADLSGGVDSRTALSLLLESGEFDTRSERIALLSGVNQKEDLAVAHSIAEAYGLQVNGPAPASRALVSGERAYEHWRAHSLGVYTPIYVSATFQNPFEIHAHGAGGETVKQYYSVADTVDMLPEYTGKMPAPDLETWSSELRATEEYLSSTAPDVTPSILHYIHFRNRFHFGHIPQARPLFTPLNSKYAIRALSALPPEQRRRFYFDVMETLAPGLKDHPYDRPEKAPTAQELDQLLVLGSLGTAPSGAIYADPTVQESRPDDPLTGSFQRWQDDIEHAAQQKNVRDFIMGNAMRRTDASIELMRGYGRPYHSHSVQSIQLSHLLMVDFTLNG